MRIINHRTSWQLILATFLCLLLTVGGGYFASHMELPLHATTLGIMLNACLLGPICASIVGISSGLILSFLGLASVWECLAFLVLALTAGWLMRHRSPRHLFGTMTVAVVSSIPLALAHALLSTFVYAGTTNNTYGDGVIGFLHESSIDGFPAVFIGNWYVDFADLFLSALCVFCIMHLYRFLRKSLARVIPTAALLLLVIGLCFAPVSFADEIPDYDDYVQTIYSSNNGLPCGEANDIAMTRDGVLWVGTYAGLYRYNGSEFQWVDTYDTVRNVNCLYVDEEGRLWIGTNDNGLSIAIHDKVVNVIDQSMGLPSNSVRCIIQAHDGDYYIGTTSSLQILQLNSGLKILHTLDEINYADSIAADTRGYVATVSSGGQLFLIKEEKVLSSLLYPDEDEEFNCCAFNESQELLCGTSLNQILVYDIQDGVFTEKRQIVCPGLQNIKSIQTLDSGLLFVSADNGIGYLDADEIFHAINTNTFRNSIDNMLRDYQGNLWFTSSRLGLLRLAPSAFKDVYGTIGMERKVVNTIVEWENLYYIGTDNGLDAVDLVLRHQVQNDLTDKLRGKRIRCMTVDQQNHLWICTYGSGLMEILPDGTQYLYNAENGSFGNRARVVTTLRDGSILAAGDTGISFIRDHNIEKTIRYEDGLINSMILTLTERNDGTILAGTDGDGIAVLRDQRVETMLTREHGLPSGVILRTIQDPSSDGIFVVTSNSLCYLTGDNEVRVFNQFPYFNNYNVCIRDDLTLFVMSSAGIYVTTRDSLMNSDEALTWELLDHGRGLTSSLTANSFAHLADNGDLFLPCDTGVFVMNVNNYDHTVRSYRMSLNSFRVDGVNQTLEHTGALSVPSTATRIELVPEILNYTIQDPYVGYWLEGFDADWTMIPESDLSSIVYTNLPSGTYTFHIAVLDHQKTERIEEQVYTLIKESRIYDESWFAWYLAGMLMVFVICVSGMLFQYRNRKILEQKAREQKEMQHKQQLLEQQLRMGNETILAIAKAVDAKDGRTSQHSRRVANYSRLLGEKMGFSEKECQNLEQAALMHDIGKIGIPDSILNKPARLTDDEYAYMKSHAARGADILKDFTMIEHVVDGAKYHHERYDGKGYPEGLKGEEIPLYGRIIGVADAFDAMTANRIYRHQMDYSIVLDELLKGRGTQFDPKILDLFLELIDEKKIDLDEIYHSGMAQSSDEEGADGT